jgi:hypothetical protein
MFILKGHWDLRMLWAVLTVTAKFYICCLSAATGYSLVFLVRTAYRSHGLSKHGAASDSPQTKREIIKMAKGIENVRQLHTLFFFLFGVFCTNEIYAAVRAIQDSRMSLSALGFEVFGPVIAFAFCTFVTFACLHSFQWIVAARVQSMSVANLYSLENQ